MKIRSLSLKLALYYTGSVLIIIAVSFVFMGYISLERAKYSAERLMESGVGYINGNTPETVLDGPDFSNIPIDEILDTFSMLEGYSTKMGIDSDPRSTWMEISYTNLGPAPFTIRVYSVDFPVTVVSPGSNQGPRNLYFQPTSDKRVDIVIVASLDQQSLSNIQAAKQFYRNGFAALPLVLIFTGFFSWFVSRRTVAPIKTIATVAQQMSETDLRQRVDVKSSDEIGSLACSFNDMADRLESAFIAQKQFVSDAAHELRTPLASLKTSVTKSMSSVRTNEEYQQLLDFVLHRVNTLEELISDLLFLARADEGRLRNGVSIFDLSPVAHEVGDSFKYLFEDKNINYSSDIEPGLYIKGNPKLLMRVLSNLLDNASKYTPAGGDVCLKASLKDNEVTITVTDTGKGMSKEHQAHVFDRFYKAPDNPGSEHSFGLGLSISKSIVTVSGGEISVTSKLGKGSTFSLRFLEAE
ncbi:MAG: sensor histidine kinase [Dehalogenimonas sp.]